MIIREAATSDRHDLVSLIAEFRVTLASFRGTTRNADLESATHELDDYQRPGFRIYVAEVADGTIGGYLVCRTDESVVWAESIYVRPDLRRTGVGSVLYRRAEDLVQKLGGKTVYNWVHPNNDIVVSFLRKRGYDVLNLVELRRRHPGERPERRIKVGDHEFRYSTVVLRRGPRQGCPLVMQALRRVSLTGAVCARLAAFFDRRLTVLRSV